MNETECSRRKLPKPSVQSWSDAKEYYDVYVGEIHWGYDRQEHERYWDWRWQPLSGGNHTAIGDCRALLELIHKMATSQVTVLIPPRKKTKAKEELERLHPSYKAKVDEPELEPSSEDEEEEKRLALDVPTLLPCGLEQSEQEITSERQW